MPDITMSEVRELADPRLRAIANRVFMTLQLEAEKAIAHFAEPANYPETTDPNSAEQIFLARFKELTPTKQQAAVARIMASVKAPAATREAFYGDLAKVNLRISKSVGDQVKALQFPTNLKFPFDHLKSLTNLHGQILVPYSIPTPPAHGGLAPQQTTDKLRLRIHKVRCVDETNGAFGSEWGSDEIRLGGITVDESADVKRVAPFTVKNDFDDGEVKVYSPPRQFAGFSLLEGTTFPKSYFVTLVLAEEDMGNFGDFLNKLWDLVKDRVLEMVSVAVGNAVDALTIPGLGRIVGPAVAYVVRKFLPWLLERFNDDVFKPATVSVSIPSLSARWSGGKTDSPEGFITYKGYGGEYQLTYDWQMYA